MRILVFSDSHKNVASCARVINTIVGTDMIIHAGDHASDAAELERLFPGIPVKYVSGNCDFSSAPSELIIEAEGKRIFLTHGHGYNVKYDDSYFSLINHARSLNCDCVVFGHTHQGYNDNLGDLIVLNPGSIKYGATYGVIEIEEGIMKSAICDASYII